MTEAEQNRLIIENRPLVTVIAADFRDGEVEFEDLVSEGHRGLVEAARLFDPSRGDFRSWAPSKIRLAIFNFVEAEKRRRGPNVTEVCQPTGGDSIEKIYEWDHWGESGNARAIQERWSKLDASPEELSELYDDVRDKRDKFAAAFMSLTGNQRKLIEWVYLADCPMPITEAALELGTSYFQTIRILKKAIRTMREVIARMESKRISGGTLAKGHPSNTGLHGYAPGNPKLRSVQ